MLQPAFPSCESARLALLQQTALLDTPAEIEFDLIVQLAARQFGVPIALISLIDSQRQWFKAKVGLDACETGRDISFCGHVVADEKMLVVNNALLDDRFSDNPLVVQGPEIRFYAGAPLAISNDLIIGTLCLIDSKPREFDLAAREQLQALADVVSELVRKRMALELLQRQRNLLITINQAQISFLLERDMAAACLSILVPLLKSTQATLAFIGSISKKQSDKQQLDIPSLVHHDSEAMSWLTPQLDYTAGRYQLARMDPIFQRVFEKAQLQCIQPGGGNPVGVKSLLAIPCQFHDEVLGVMVLMNRAGGFDKETIQQLQAVSDSIATLLHVRELEDARLHAEQELARQAQHDMLTGLYNRRILLERCMQSLQLYRRYQQNFSILMIDLDYFKMINDSLGHAAGDMVLREVSQLLLSLVRDSDTVARWGGEEFCVLLPKENVEQAMLLAQRLISAVGQLQIPWADKTIQLTISIGAAGMHNPQESLDDLLQRADFALYEAKRLGRNCAHMASPGD